MFWFSHIFFLWPSPLPPQTHTFPPPDPMSHRDRTLPLVTIHPMVRKMWESWESNVGLWYSSNPHAYCFGVENTYQCVHHELLLLQDHLLINKLQVSPQEKQALILLPALWVPGQEEVRVAHIRWSASVCQETQKLPS